MHGVFWDFYTCSSNQGTNIMSTSSLLCSNLTPISPISCRNGSDVQKMSWIPREKHILYISVALKTHKHWQRFFVFWDKRPTSQCQISAGILHTDYQWICDWLLKESIHWTQICKESLGIQYLSRNPCQTPTLGQLSWRSQSWLPFHW